MTFRDAIAGEASRSNNSTPIFCGPPEVSCEVPVVLGGPSVDHAGSPVPLRAPVTSPSPRSCSAARLEMSYSGASSASDREYDISSLAAEHDRGEGEVRSEEAHV